MYCASSCQSTARTTGLVYSLRRRGKSGGLWSELKKSAKLYGDIEAHLSLANTLARRQGPWQPGPCDSPVHAGIGSIQQSILTSATLSNYNTPSLSPCLGPEDVLANPLSSLGLDHDCLADFGSEVVSSPQKDESPTSQDEKNECPSTMRRMRRREQNRESYVS